MRAAVRGDEAALLRLAANVFGLASASEARFRAPAAPLQVQDRGSNPALFVATICEEVRFPWERGAALQQRVGQAETALRGLPRAAVTPFDQESIAGVGLLTLCIGWPNATPAPPPPGALPNVPALLLSGGADVRTPVEDVPALVRRLPGAQAVTIPFVGHSVLGGDPSGCSQAAVAGFFNGAGVAPCPRRGPLVDPIARPPRSLGSLPRSGGYPGRVGRTLTAVFRTRDDALLQAVALGLARETRSGGLRAGTITLRSTGVTLRNVQVVPGVSVSGTFPEQGNVARLRVTGRAAARGSLRITRSGRVTGTLAGRRIRTRSRARAASVAASWDVAAQVKRLRRLERIR
jgi:hypothetical protein